ncbi:MAG: YitT family protein [Candidatus Izemoplasmatales bacterium]|nr:YitT family protein [Candidatus Izemoplasmatales bacterium]
MKKLDWRKEGKTLLYTFVGTFVYAIGILFFINPAQLYAGGVTGVSQLIINILSDQTGGAVAINLGLLVMVFQIPLLIFAWYKLSRRFTIYTIISSVIGSIILAFSWPNSIMGNDLLTAGLIGGVLGGVGNGILAIAGTSGGGTSILFQYWQIKTGRSMGMYQIALHGVIILLAGLLFGLDIAVYTIISQVISSIVLDKVFTGYNFIKLEVITTKGLEIANELKTRLPHGVTMIDAIGAYTHQEKTVLYAVISVHEMQMYVRLIREIDPAAFIVMTPVQKVLGKFTKKIIG